MLPKLRKINYNYTNYEKNNFKIPRLFCEDYAESCF